MNREVQRLITELVVKRRLYFSIRPINGEVFGQAHKGQTWWIAQAEFWRGGQWTVVSNEGPDFDGVVEVTLKQVPVNFGMPPHPRPRPRKKLKKHVVLR